MNAAAHAFVRPGQVAPDLPAPDACMRCGQAEAVHLAGAERAARVTAATAALGDFRRFEDKAARVGYHGTDWALWAGRLAAALGSLLDGETNTLTGVETNMVAGGQLDADQAGLDGGPLNPYEDQDSGLEPYCAACGEWIGRFAGLENWQHFRGDGAPGGQRELYEADHLAEVSWVIPAGRVLSPAGLATLGDALADAVDRCEPSGDCADCDLSPAALCEPHSADLDRCDRYLVLARQLGIWVER